ncbi:hypothetical protein [Longimicrobium sp.]|uniref:hypothetical protein n=1 Tax=Longimicrobium sp. TaxID=2029185 RepID=UPI002C6B1AEB|nr:hypothetical protein [Longimicrobium sp.]HSU13178.1 hypothetical protein [Longimicrobium sp.]
MPTQKLNIEALTVETFDAAPVAVAMLDDAYATGSRCSAIDRCPTRLCDTTLC